MANRISGPGVGLQLPQGLYPTGLQIANADINANTNIFGLAPGEALPVPAGEYFITLGKYCSLQYMDPVTTAWTLLRDGVNAGAPAFVRSDGFNVRVANLTGCVVGAYVNTTGSGFTGAVTLTPSTGNSTWIACVGGSINSTTSITAVGKGYGIAPLVFFDAPPAPGVCATAVANISGGTVTSLTMVNYGAGYPVAPGITILPNPADPNLTTGITNATALCSLTGAGSITAAICTNSGAPVATTMSLTVAGSGGSGATITTIFMTTFASASFTNAGTGYGTYTALTTLPGSGAQTNSGTTFVNPQISLVNFVPRQAQITTVLSGTGISSTSTIVDGGLFLTTPSPLLVTNGIITTISTVTLTMGSTNDTVIMQPL